MIFADIDEEHEESAFKSDPEMELSMPELFWDALKLNSHIKDMDSVEFW